MTYKTSIVMERDEYGFYAFCLDLPGCQSEGESFDQAMKNIREAIELYLETLSKDERKAYLSREIMTGSVEITLEQD